MTKAFNINRLLKAIINYEYISFDVFDTLIKRNCANPKDIFLIVQNEYNKLHCNNKISNFRDLRVLAEQKARADCSEEDVSLDEIYGYIDLSNKVRDEFKKIELDVEFSFCQRNNTMYEVYKFCVEHNKKIICISDMYLSKADINKILLNCGYKIDNIFVSSDERKTKSNGSIFNEVLKKLKINKNEILHIGDSYKADFLSPIKLGIHSFHIPKRVKHTIFFDNVGNFHDLNVNILTSFINNNTMIHNDYFEKIGYEIIGPLCLQFSQWIYRTASTNNIDNLLFCARDMKMIQQIFCKLYGNEIKNSYFYVSRKSTYLPYLYINDNFDSFKKLLPFGKKKIKIYDVLSMYNIKIDELSEILSKYNLDSNEAYDLNKLQFDQNFINFYNDVIKNVVTTTGKQQYVSFNNYLNKLGITDNTAIVDLGWRGTTQNILIKTLNKNICGLYYGLHSLNGDRLNDNFFTYLFYGKDNGYSDKIYSFMTLCELFFSALHGSTVAYSDNEKKPYILNKSVNEKNEVIEKIQFGAMNFINEFYPYFKYLTYSNNTFFSDALIKIGTKPTLKEAINFGNIYTENLNTRKLINAKPFFFYLFHPKTFKFDFMDSEWKIGFMKKVFMINIDYYKLYNFLRNLR